MFDINKFIAEHGLQNKDVVPVLKDEFSKMDKFLFSKVCHPELYGVRLVEGGENLLTHIFSTKPPAARRADKHRVRYSVRCRITKAQKTRLQQAFKRDGYKTIQNGMSTIIEYYIRRGLPKEEIK